MSNVLDQLLGKIDDPSLKGAIAQEVERLRDTKEFGLVFERHLPETAKLPNHPVRRDTTVQRRAPGEQTRGVVTEVKKDVATVAWHEGDTEDVPLDELVVVAAFGEPIYPGLRSVGRIERGGDKPFHTVINAENYHALQMLQFTHRESVDVIYIDPPYNTGAKDWKYNNNYVDGADAYRHSKWLSFMERRLQLAKRLLNPSRSVLLVTIDEKEVHRLGLLLDEVFPSAKRQLVTIVIAPAGQARGQEFARVEEYMFVVYVGDATVSPTADPLLGDPPTSSEEDKAGTAVSWESLVRRGTSARREDRPNQFFPIFIDGERGRILSFGDPLDAGQDRQEVDVPEGQTAVWPLRTDGSEGRWRVGKESLQQLHEQGFVRVGRFSKKRNSWSLSYVLRSDLERIEEGKIKVVGFDEDGGHAELEWAAGTTSTTLPKTVWHREAHNAGNHGSAMLRTLLPGRDFPFPKSLYAVEDALWFFVKDNPDAVILDFFGGSGTTTHATARLNHRDGGRRRSLLITNNEVSEDEAKALRSAGAQPGDPEWEKLGIFEHVTRPRVEAALLGKDHTGASISGTYKYNEEFAVSDGLEENVEFMELTYQHPSTVARGRAFAEVAPLLWLMAGARGPRVDEPCGSYAAPDGSTYAVLFDPTHVRDLVTALDAREEIETVFIVTDSTAVYQQAAAEMPAHVETVRLYESYLRSFEINTGDDL